MYEDLYETLLAVQLNKCQEHYEILQNLALKYDNIHHFHFEPQQYRLDSRIKHFDNFWEEQKHKQKTMTDLRVMKWICTKILELMTQQQYELVLGVHE